MKPPEHVNCRCGGTMTPEQVKALEARIANHQRRQRRSDIAFVWFMVAVVVFCVTAPWLWGWAKG